MLWAKLWRRKSVQEIITTGEKTTDKEALKKSLTTIDLTAMGIAAIIGAGIFSTIGNAAAEGGPGVSLLFVFTAIACGFSALCYAEFASVLPIAGSAYTYAYVAFGELVAWIIGWDLLMEYAIGNIAVAISWSDYFTSLLANPALNIHLPDYWTMDYLTAQSGYEQVLKEIQVGKELLSLDKSLQAAYQAWLNAPQLFGLHIIMDLPALFITAIITTLVYIGVQESKRASNAMVAIKLTVIIGVIIVGFFYVDTQNWSPFFPNGIGGVLKGVSAVFFAYIGFDALSTTAEECKNPQRDLPRGMFLSLIICTILYVLISLVLTGMIPFSLLKVGDPLAYVFEHHGMSKISGIIGVSAVVAMASVLLVFQLGQPRIWMAMSRDGLLPPIFAKIHPKFKTPAFSTIVAGLLVALPSLFFNLTEVTDLTSIGTLFAFVLVCGGVIRLQNDPAFQQRKFKTPFIDARYVLLPLAVAILVFVHWQNPDFWQKELSLDDIQSTFWHKIPFWMFVVLFISLTIQSFRQKLPAIPILGLLSCFYLMTELKLSNWIGFGIWLLIGLSVYFLYGVNNSRTKITQKLS
ncbi:MAG: amino acid permease [Bacteroidia bacterium]|nr:amino acid permease [Bacteroidia bacterium]